MKDLVHSLENSWSPAAVLAAVFAAGYVAVGPGCLFSVDEVNVVETAQAVLERGNLEIPAIPVSVLGVGGGYHSVKPPGLAYACLPLVALGNLLDDVFGSLKGGTAQGQPIGTDEHPLRWGGRLVIFTALITNAALGGVSVALLFLIGRRLGASPRACLLMALVSGSGTLLASESTHLFRHPLEELGLLLGFWFFSDREAGTVARRMLFGTASLSIAFLAGPNTVAPAVVLWFYGVVKAWNGTQGTGCVRSRLRLLVRPIALGLMPALISLGLYLWFNHVRFGDVAEFGYHKVFQVSVFQLNVREAMLALSAYLASPTLSIFLFAPPLLLALPALADSLRRWPLETKALLWAAGAHLALVTSTRFWHGASSYGPRYVLVSILLVMPLTLPAFERIERGASSSWRVAFAATLSLGLLVQILGLAVYVNVDTLRLVEGGYQDAWSPSAPSTGRWVFVPSLSPPLVHLRELLAGRNVIPWALRAIKQPGLPLAVWVLLAVTVGVGALWLWRFSERSDSPIAETRLPEKLVLALAFLIGVGSLLTGRVREPLPQRISGYLNEGMAAHREGRLVMAQESYALVLGLDPQNEYALYNLGLLHETAGQVGRAISLFRRAVALDPGFTVASAGLARLGAPPPGARPGLPGPAKAASGEPENAWQCHSRAQASWDVGNKKVALEVWEECGRTFPAQAAFLRNVARCRYDLGDFEGAVRDYRRLTVMLPDDLVAHTDLAWALLRARKLSEARQICQTVLARDPGNPSAQAVLDQLEAVQGPKAQ